MKSETELEEELAAIEKRFIALETKISYTEDFVLKLQNEVVSHQKQLETLRAENKEIFARLANGAPDFPEKKPPHY